jgi:hypothetical protein
MSLRDDIDLARDLLHKPLSPHTEPSEKEARAAAYRVLHALEKLLFKIDNDPRGANLTDDSLARPLAMFLVDLKFAIDPASRTKDRLRHHTRKVNFSDATTRSGQTRAANQKHLDIARRVRELRKAGAKAPVLTTANEFKVGRETVSRICADPDLKEYLDRLDARDSS